MIRFHVHFLFSQTPEKKTTKNNIDTHVRIPEFQSSPNRRLRSESNTSSDRVQLINSDIMEQNERERDEQHQMQLVTLRDRARLRRNSETETQRQDRLRKDRERAETRRANETQDQRRDRLEQKREHARITRTNESEEEHQSRIDRQRERTQSNRNNKQFEKRAIDNFIAYQQDMHDHAYDNNDYIHPTRSSINGIGRNDNVANRNRIQGSSTWPAPISTKLKEECLQQFLERMSMDNLAEVTCAICNVRSSKQQCKIVPTSTIFDNDLLKVSDELKDLITNIQLSVPKLSNGNIQWKTLHLFKKRKTFKF